MHRKINKLLLFMMVPLLITGFCACTQNLVKEHDEPEDLIHRDTMVSIFVDLRLMDAVLNHEQQQASRKINEIRYHLHNSVMIKYGITRDQFERSFTYYQYDLHVIDQIYADAITRLTKMKSMIEME